MAADVINFEMLKNPANWLVIGSMALVGSFALNAVLTHVRRNAAENGASTHE